MDISKYVAELLFNFECVVIPGFGGFIVNDKPSSLNRINHQFKPPFRYILLNTHLKANDGLLVNQIAASEGISFKDARLKVDVFVANSLRKLEKGETVTFTDIGKVHYDNNKNIVFEQDTRVNYNPDSYGLTGFVSTPVKRITDEEKLRNIIIPSASKKSKPVDRKPEQKKEKEKKKRSLWPVLLLVGIIIILLSVGWGIMNPEKAKSYWKSTTNVIATLAPDFSQQSKQNVVNEARYIPRRTIESDKEILAKIERSEELLKTMEESIENSPEPEITVMPKEEIIPESTVINKREKDLSKEISRAEQIGPLYYIIAGSFSNENNAKRLVSNLKLKGYDATIADTNANGMFRVAYAGIKRLDAAKEKLYAIRQDDNPDAWLFRK